MEKTEISELLSRLPHALLPWYEAHRRDLPWRRDRQPYHVWLSEIMLQQTRVEAVKGYYTRFLEALPTVESLADCDEEALSKLWEGLGYYSRMRNLKKAAGVIRDLGKFPDTYEEIRALPGIGDYTAGAVCSIAYDLPTPAVDGNVLRVYTRLTEDGTPIETPAFKVQVREALAEIYPSRAGDFTQALMELGATVCGPNRAPDCEACPCSSFCGGCLHGTAQRFPVKLPKKKRREEDRTVFILRCGDAYALTKRPEKGLLARLWQFPDVPGTLEIPQALAYLETRDTAVTQVLRQVEKKHIFTHIVWNMRGIYLETREQSGPFTWMTGEQIRTDAALPTAYRQFWEEFDHV